MIDVEKNLKKQVVYDNGVRTRVVFLCCINKEYPDLAEIRYSRPKKGQEWRGTFLVNLNCLKEF